MWTAEQLTALADTQPRTLVPIVLDIQARLQALAARMALNSQNSSKPPSSDGYTKPAPKSLRKKSGLRPGGQHGHPGNTLLPAEKPDCTILHRLKRCPCGCGANLRGRPLLRIEKRQVFDLPEILRVLKPGGKVCLLEYVNSRRPWRRLWMRVLSRCVEALYGARFDRDTRAHLIKAGFSLIEERFVHADIILKLVGQKVAG